MRVLSIFAVGFVVVLAMDVRPGHAQNRPWCTEHSLFSSEGGFPDCSYQTQEQCRATASGTGLHCTPNPWYQPERAAPIRQKRARHGTRGRH